MKERADYQRFQVLHDLHALFSSVDKRAFESLLGNANEADQPALKRLIAIQGSAFDLPLDVIFDCLTPLSRAANDGKLSDEVFIIAATLLLVDALNLGIGFGEDDQAWGRLAARIRTLPARRRAAIMRGYYLLFEQTSYMDKNPVSATDLISAPKQNIQADLLNIAQRASKKEIRQIADADFRQEADAHYAALLKLIWEGNGILVSDKMWVPSEVVRLTAYGPKNIGFETCTALLLISEIEADSMLGLGFMWESNEDSYSRLKPNIRDTFFRAFRTVYERSEKWDPYSLWTPDKLEVKGVAIPYFDG